MAGLARDIRIRERTFAWLEEQVELHGDVLPRDLLARGFVLEGEQIRLVGPQGIFKPQALDLPLSITTVAGGPYADHFGSDGLLEYKYRGQDPEHRDNVGLRTAWRERVPLVYLHGLVPGRYVAAWPVFIVGDNPLALTFTVAVDAAQVVSPALADRIADVTALDARDEGRRQYVTGEFRRRLHQRSFRERVLRAYRQQCALCRLRHVELLDAAHIIPDSEEGGEPRVPNGLALCKLHHAAFDRQFVGIRADLVVEVRRDVLEETDGPMLRHGLQGMHGQRIRVPRRAEWRPDPELLERRYERFREVG